MGSIQRQDSFDDNGDLINLAEDVFPEAPTLTSQEMDRARREALEVLRNNSPQEAFRIFTQGLRNNAESPVAESRAEQADVYVVVDVPPKTVGGEPKTAPPAPNN